MAVVEMYIDKFQRVVLIDDDHPLALAQVEKNAAQAAASLAARDRAPSSTATTAPARGRRK